MVLLEPESSYFLTNSQLWPFKTAEISAEESGLPFHFLPILIMAIKGGDKSKKKSAKNTTVVCFADFYPYKNCFFVFVFFPYVITSA